MPVLKCLNAGCQWQSQDLDVAFADALTKQLEMHNQEVHAPAAAAAAAAAAQAAVQAAPRPMAAAAPPRLKLDPPRIDSNCDPDKFSAFTRQWTMYKVGMAIASDMTTTALFYCCTDELRTDLLRDIRSDVALMTETDLLAAIKRLAVKEESTLVHRIRLSRMMQSPGTGIRSFLANLRGQAALCQYTAWCTEAGCTHVYDFSEEIIKDNLIRGIADPEILADLLGDTKTDRSLDETVAYIAQKEQGKSTRSVVGDSAGAIQSTTGTQSQAPKTPASKSPCWACGGSAHSQRNDRNARSQYCPAWSFTCTKCSVKGHYSANCSKCSSCGSWGHRDNSSRFCLQSTRKKTKPTGNRNAVMTMCEDEPSVYDQLCVGHSEAFSGPMSETVSNTLLITTPHSPPLQHHIFNGHWVPRPSQGHPVMSVTLQPSPHDHAVLGHPMPDLDPSTSLSPHTTLMVADSGCQSCIMPVQSVYATGLRNCDIMPVLLTMRGAIREDLGVIGGVVMVISTHDKANELRSTKQLVYVSNTMDQAFLSREALTNLGALPPDFPAIPARPQLFAASTEAPICSCPQRPAEPPPLPTSLPPGLNATPEDVPALKQWILDYYASSTFNTCTHQPLRMMTGEPLRLYVDPDAKPYAVHKPAIIPIHWQEQVFNDLERDVRLGVLEKVPQNTPVTWCSRMVVAPKADGSPRRTVDLQHLNRHAVRQTHHVESPFHLAEKVPQNTFKTVTDAWNGYHSVPLHPDDRHLTTFITPWGRYRYKVAPQGFISSGDAYNLRFDAIIADFPDKVKCVDDTLKWKFRISDSFFQLCQWCDLMYRNGITLHGISKPEKLQFAQPVAEFAGLTITLTNVCPSTRFLQAIKDFPTPTDITGARAWFGLINQGAYAFSMAKQMQPFRHLLKPSNKFVWTDELESLFRQSKDIIINEMRDGVRLFRTSRPTCLSTDWSTQGIGFLLRQKYCQCTTIHPACCPDGWKLCLVGSRFTSPAESRYSPIEGEALAVAYALHQTKYYILGCDDLIVATDHKPLLQILNDRPLAEIQNRRLLNLKEKTLPFRFRIIHVSGRSNQGPDATSRYPAHQSGHLNLPCDPSTPPEDIAGDTNISSAACATLYSVSDVVTWDMVREATTSDDLLQQLGHIIQEGFPEDCRSLSPDLRPYHKYRDSLSYVDGVILLGDRIVIPPPLRPNILHALHAAHQGVSAMCARAADSVFWPNITVDITKTREQCGDCHRIAKSNPRQPPTELEPPDYPFQQVCCDYFNYMNHDYVVLVDRYSNWPMAFRSESGALGLIKRLREVFVTFGCPEVLNSDGGPQFIAEALKAFLKAWGVTHRVSSVANPHANCRAEIGVKTVKRMLMDNLSPNGSLDTDKFQKAMLAYRNTIDPETKASPAMIIFGRPIRDAIPIPLGKYCPHPTWRELMAHREKALAKRHTREHEKWDEHTRALPPLKVGDAVFLQNLTGNHPKRWERTGVIVEVRQFHQYVVRVNGSGRVTLRNRQHLRKYVPFRPTPTPTGVSPSHLPPAAIPRPPPTALAPVPHPTTGSNLAAGTPMPSPLPVKEPSPASKVPTPPVVTVPTPISHVSAGPRPSPSPMVAHSPTTPEMDTLPQTSTPRKPTGGTTSDPSPAAGFPTDSAIAPHKLPRAVARLLPHNAPGASESPPTGRRRRAAIDTRPP